MAGVQYRSRNFMQSTGKVTYMAFEIIKYVANVVLESGTAGWEVKYSRAEGHYPKGWVG